MNPKTPAESKTVLTDLVLPSDTNPLGNLFGGELLSRMDRAACIAAERHAGNVVVTASVNHVHFRKPVPLGSVLTVEAKVSRAFTKALASGSSLLRTASSSSSVTLTQRLTSEADVANSCVFSMLCVPRIEALAEGGIVTQKRNGVRLDSCAFRF